MTTQSTQATIQELQKQIEALKATIPQVKVSELTVKIGDKGTINVYGLGRFPVCLYLSQATKLADLFKTKEFGEFISANLDKLASKDKA